MTNIQLLAFAAGPLAALGPAGVLAPWTRNAAVNELLPRERPPKLGSITYIIKSHPQSRLDELLPWACPTITALKAAACHHRLRCSEGDASRNETAAIQPVTRLRRDYRAHWLDTRRAHSLTWSSLTLRLRCGVTRSQKG